MLGLVLSLWPPNADGSCDTDGRRTPLFVLVSLPQTAEEPAVRCLFGTGVRASRCLAIKTGHFKRGRNPTPAHLQRDSAARRGFQKGKRRGLTPCNQAAGGWRFENKQDHGEKCRGPPVTFYRGPGSRSTQFHLPQAT
ncbi:hypothetical protein AAFF_G00106710 [Aldrovandia affinis]|uniref:Secreted protein n=1 Tax=Aldrovandia affinis TaxID=143900 RepID=A0AAD7T278_9TELE|nr:hypothetical protein AAFF_G00106710 [Aldrovandia affinis]